MNTGAKRLIYLIHRWTGVGACVLMALWFVSGMVMLFIGYPKLTPWERLGALPPLRLQACCIPVELALQNARRDISLHSAETPVAADTAHGHTHVTMPEVILTSISGQPYYRFRLGHGPYVVVDARTGKLAPPVDTLRAQRAAESFAASVHAHGEVLGLIAEDRWTHSGALNAHRPFYAVQMDDADHTLLYVSSVTGQVVMDAPRIQRAWNYVGAWLHWLYMFRNQPSDPVWNWTVIVLSAIGTVTAMTGTLAGIWRWRFSGHYKSGSHSPYREPYLRWHHISGLLFAAIVFSWIFSGLMSMNPLGIFSSAGGRPDVAAYRGGNPADKRLALEAPAALALLAKENFRAVELEWQVLDGRPYLLARDSQDNTRLIVQQGDGHALLRQWPRDVLLQAAARLMTAPILSVQELGQYDAYYYGRTPEAMNGASEKRLPVLRVKFADATETWAHLDVHTGDMESSLDRPQRAGRWMFNFLHSWDLPALVQSGPWRQAVLILLSMGGLVISITGVVIGYRRMRTWLLQRRGRCG